MTTDLIPLLSQAGGPPSPGGSDSPPVVSTTQELADWLYNQLSSTSPDPNELGFPSLTYELLRFLVGITTQDTTGIWPRVGAIFNILDVLAPTFEYLANPGTAGAPTLGETVGSETGITIPTRFETLSETIYRHVRVSELELDLTSPEWVAGVPLGFTGGTVLHETADMYRVVILNPEDYRQHQETDGPDRLHRLGWWAEISDTMVGRRDLIEWPDQCLHMSGHRMRGVIIKIAAHINATVTPYNLVF